MVTHPEMGSDFFLLRATWIEPETPNDNLVQHLTTATQEQTAI